LEQIVGSSVFITETAIYMHLIINSEISGSINLFKSFSRGVNFLGASAITIALTLSAHAAEQKRQFSIDAQPLARALTKLSAQADITVFAKEELVKGKKAKALSGNYTTEEAVSLLLEGSNLTTAKGKNGTIIIKRRETSSKAKPANNDLRPIAYNSPIEEMIVVGNTTNVDITSRDLDRLQANDLADIFRDIPSVAVGGSLGIAQKIYVRGVEDTLLNVTVDGAPQTGTLFHHIGRVSIEPELLKQVEVQAGAGEATSGFGAVGGAVRFRTKSASDLLEDGENFGGFAKASYFSNDGYKLSASLFGRLSDNWDILTSYVWVDRENMEDGAGNPILGSAAEQSLAFIKIGGKLSRNQSLTVSYEQRDEEGEFGQRPNWQTLQDATLFPVTSKRQTAVANYQLQSGDALNLEATGYYTRSRFVQNRFDRWGKYGATLKSFGFDLRNTSEIGSHTMTFGAEYRDDEVTSEYLADESVWTVWAWDPSIGVFTETGSVFGLYFQDHFQVTEPLTFSFGARYDSYDLEQVTFDDETSSDGFSFNLGLSYALTENFTFTAGYAEALRGKEVGDAFTLDQRPGRITLDPNLEAERANNFEAGLAYDDGAFFASGTYYRSKIKDVILDQLGSGPAPQNSVYYENVGTFDAEGFEFRLGYTADHWRADAFFTTYEPTLNGNPVEGYEHIGLANAPGDKLVVNLNYMPSASLDFGIRVTHVSDLNDIEVLHRAREIGWIDELQTVDKPGYVIGDIYVQWLPTGNEDLKVNLAVNNVFDKLYRDHATVADYNSIPGWGGVAGLYEAGRDIRLSVSFGF
jgi:hemoglobin/transferrin/lactoferrin receptor protein